MAQEKSDQTVPKLKVAFLDKVELQYKLFDMKINFCTQEKAIFCMHRGNGGTRGFTHFEGKKSKVFRAVQWP